MNIRDIFKRRRFSNASRLYKALDELRKAKKRHDMTFGQILTYQYRVDAEASHAREAILRRALEYLK